MDKNRYRKHYRTLEYEYEPDVKFQLLPTPQEARAEMQSLRYGRICKYIRDKIRDNSICGYRFLTLKWDEFPKMLLPADQDEIRNIIEKYGYIVKKCDSESIMFEW
jgi:hypothetical protein